jgi:hypothetical protein
MNKLFEILDVNNSTIIVIGKSYYGISNYISDLEKELDRRQFRGEIIFDFLLSNGLRAKNRFMQSNYNGSIGTIKICQIDIIEHYYKKSIINFYRENIEILHNGILLQNDIKNLKKYFLEIN